MTRIVKLRIDRLRLNRSAAGLGSTLPAQLQGALETVLTAQLDKTDAHWPAATRPELRHAAERLAEFVPPASKKDAT